jgi:predicted PurR-regulated permease PerM
MNLTPLLIVFFFINLVWFSLFSYFFTQKKEDNIVKKNSYQNWEKSQIRIWLENLILEDVNLEDTKKLSNLLDNNYQKITKINLFSALYQLKSLILSGTAILFLFFYYNFYCEGKGGLEWSIYFIANNLQQVIQKAEKSFNLASSIFSLKRNYQEIEDFFN